jgi:hypothetical protein
MKEKVVGKFKRVTYNEETGDVDFTITVTDAKFKKKLIRNLFLSGNLKVIDDCLVYVPSEEDDSDA